MNGYQIVLIDGYDRPKINATGQQIIAMAREPVFRPSIVVKKYDRQ